MRAAPGHLNVDAIKEAMMGVPNVRAIHDLHVWTLSTSLVSLSAHVVAPADQHEVILREIEQVLRTRFGIQHTTIQLDSSDLPPCDTTI